MFPMNTVAQSQMSQQPQTNGMRGFDSTRDSGYYSPRAGTGLGVRTDMQAEGSRTPSPKAPIPSVRSYDQRSGMGRPPPDPHAIPRRRPVGSPTANPIPPSQHNYQQHQYHNSHQQYQSQPVHEEPVMMGEERRPTYGAAMLHPGWGSAAHAYDPISPTTRGITIEHEYDATRSPPRGGNMDHGYGAVPSSPRGRHDAQ